jgi:glycine/D-amino acid oxidase-like deaminating enzyme
MTEFSPDTFYDATARPGSERPPLVGDIETDVCVIGGGFAGLWTARALLARGQQVVLLEAGKIASEASGRNGGFVSAGYAECLEKIVARVGLDHARALYKLSRDGVEIVREMVAEGDFGHDVKPGRLNVLRYNDEFDLIQRAEILARDFDHDVVLWPTERVRGVLKSDRYYQALHEPDAFHLHPLNLARALTANIEARGGEIYEHSSAIDVDLDGLRKAVTTEKGRVRAFNVVLSGSAFLGKAFPRLMNTILPVRTHVAVTEPIGDVLPAVIRYEGAIADTRRGGNYYRIVGKRLLWGGRITINTKPPRKLARKMAKDIASVYPQLAGVQIDYAWSGTMGYAIHKMPQIGMVQPGVWIASAFGGHGLNTTAIAGELIASAIVEQDERWRLFIPFGLVWAGGSAGRALTQAAYWSIQMKNWLDEAQSKHNERVQVDLATGLSPSIAAHTARRAKRKFLESRIGHVSARFIAGMQEFASRMLATFAWASNRIYEASVAVGRLFARIIWFVSRIIGFIARKIGRGMDVIALGVFFMATTAARAVVFVCRTILAPIGRQIAFTSTWAWRVSHLGSTKFARAFRVWLIWVWMRTKEGAGWTLECAKRGMIYWDARLKQVMNWSKRHINETATSVAAWIKRNAILARESDKGNAIRDTKWTSAAIEVEIGLEEKTENKKIKKRTNPVEA